MHAVASGRWQLRRLGSCWTASQVNTARAASWPTRHMCLWFASSSCCKPARLMHPVIQHTTSAGTVAFLPVLLCPAGCRQLPSSMPASPQAGLAVRHWQGPLQGAVPDAPQRVLAPGVVSAPAQAVLREWLHDVVQHLHASLLTSWPPGRSQERTGISYWYAWNQQSSSRMFLACSWTPRRGESVKAVLVSTDSTFACKHGFAGVPGCTECSTQASTAHLEVVTKRAVWLAVHQQHWLCLRWSGSAAAAPILGALGD